MAFAGYEHHVAGARLGDGHVDGGGALEDGVDACGGVDGDAGADVVGDVLGILGAGVVVGDDDAVGEACGHFAHLGTFAAVAVAAGAEDGDDLSAAGADGGADAIEPTVLPPGRSARFM